MAKTQVYSWRVAAETKAELQRAAKRANQSVSGLLDRIVREWLDALRSNGGDLAEQQRLHAAAAKCIGVLRGGNPHRAEEATRAIRARLAASHARQRPR
jgi:hypothetical protein